VNSGRKLFPKIALQLPKVPVTDLKPMMLSPTGVMSPSKMSPSKLPDLPSILMARKPDEEISLLKPLPAKSTGNSPLKSSHRMPWRSM
jgi:hypothetical protein